MHSPTEKDPVDNQEMGAEGGPPRNTEAQPSDQDPVLADGGAIPPRRRKMANGGMVPKGIPKADQFKEPPEPKPQPKMVQDEVAEDGQRNRLGRTIKKYADGDQVTPPVRPGQETSGQAPPPATGLEPAQPVPETNLGHLVHRVEGAVGGIASSGFPGNYTMPLVDKLSKAGKSITDWANSPYQPDGQPPQQPTSDIAPAQMPPNAKHMDMPATSPPPQGGGAVPSRSARPQGPSKPAPQAPPDGPMDFSKVDVDHQQIPNTTVQEWEQSKNSIIQGLVAKGMPMGQAQMEAENEISDYQHKNFLQYMQQGIALDGAGDKNGAMAALKTAYQYMPTGHDMSFGVDKTTGKIVGFGVDEDTGKPKGSPVLLDQANLNRILATYSDPKAFMNESLAMREQKLRETMASQGQVPLERAQAGEAIQRGNYFAGLNQERLEAAAMRGAGSKNAMPPQTQKFYAQQLNGAIMNPADQGEALGVAAQLEGRYGNSPQSQMQIAGFLKQMYSLDPEKRQQLAAKAGIQLPGMSMPQMPQADPLAMGYNYGGYGAPPR